MQTLGNTSLFGDASSDPDLVRFCAGAQGFMDKGYSKGAAILKTEAERPQRFQRIFGAPAARWNVSHEGRSPAFPCDRRIKCQPYWNR